MSKKRSLGSDPLFHELTVSQKAFDFIGRSASESVENHGSEQNLNESDEKSDKKIVSYYLEKDLIKEIKTLAHLTNQCYSRLVSRAIRLYMEHHDI
ncbi:MAG TPA: hypothetical protein VKA34_10195 [Balneolales bacterium]|nr:hypothetical protein [Balneolales bacterium]